MTTLAIIAEYNPFHNGHLYHLNKAKELTGANYSVALMSGSFLQRGVPAMWDKYTRANMCTSCGIDLALELPFPYATGSAMDFAMGSINILNRLNSIDYLCFGAETDDIKLLKTISEVIVTEPASYKSALKTNLSSGMSFPSARDKALTDYFNDDSLTSIISQPNNILAIEYISALIRTDSKIKPVLVKRKQAMYHDDTIYGSISSATAIRHTLDNNSSLDMISRDLPHNAMTLITDTYTKSAPVFPESLTPFLQAKLITGSEYEYICDINIDFSNKLKAISSSISYEEALNTLATKDLTKTRVSRCLIHLILEYTEAMRSSFIHTGYGFYANILSFRRESSSLIKNINKVSHIPLITKKADFNNYLAQYDHIDKELANLMWTLDMRATNLYNCLVYNTYAYSLDNDYTVHLPIS